MPVESAAKGAKKPQARSRVTNGKSTLPGVDGRSVWVRRLTDLIVLFSEDMGGDAGLTEMQRALIRRAATLTVELERAEASFANAGAADPVSLNHYQTAGNSLRRLLESLGLPKRMPAINAIDAEPAVPAARREGFRLAAPAAEGEAPRYFGEDETNAARALMFIVSEAIHTGKLVDADMARIAVELGLARIAEYVGEQAVLGSVDHAPATA